MVQASLRIVLNCCHEPQFKVYAGAFDWPTLLPRLLNSAIRPIPLATKLISSCLASGLSDAYSSFWTLKSNEGDTFLKLLQHSIQAQESCVKMDNEFAFSTLDLLLGLRKLTQSNVVNAQLLASKPILSVLSAALESEDPKEVLEDCLLLWSILSSSENLQNSVEIPCLTEQLKVVACSSSPQLQMVSECVLVVLNEKTTEGNEQMLSNLYLPFFFFFYMFRL